MGSSPQSPNHLLRFFEQGGPPFGCEEGRAFDPLPYVELNAPQILANMASAFPKKNGLLWPCLC